MEKMEKYEEPAVKVFGELVKQWTTARGETPEEGNVTIAEIIVGLGKIDYELNKIGKKIIDK